MDGDAEAAGGDLLDPRAALVAVGVGRVAADVLAALAGVRHPADPVHRHRERLVRLGRERAEAHPAGGEALEDLGDRLDLVDRDRVAGGLAARAGRAASPARRSRRRPARGTRRSARAASSRRRRSRATASCSAAIVARVPGVALAVAAPGVDAALGQQRGVGGGQQRVLDVLGKAAAVRARGRRGRGARAPRGRARRGRRRRPPTACRRSSGRQVAVEPDGLEDLGAAVGLDRRDPHLRHHLQQALADRGQQPLVAPRRAMRSAGQLGAAVQVGERVEHQVGVDGGGAVADQRGEVVDLARLAGLDHEARSAAGCPRGPGAGGRRRARASTGSGPGRRRGRGRR